ncbi:MAG TPA: methyltransferase domain-containing protein [Acidimicrobiales bacterium]|nr:methyltransferase domain-containing protein [Acidimicrobiales bacterium]
MRGEELWERNARWWQASFTAGADPEYEEQILPMVDHFLRGSRRVLEVGCGEGQVSRRIAALGAEVVGLDPAPTQIRTALERDGGPRFVQARAEHLPLGDAVVDTVVVCLAIEHVDPFEPAIAEIARVLEPGGRLFLFLSHPLLQAPGSCWVDDQVFGEQYWRVGPYLPDDVMIDEVAPGVELPFAHRPLSRYVHTMGSLGLWIEDMVEPPPSSGVQEQEPGFEHGDTIPRLMLLCARRVT